MEVLVTAFMVIVFVFVVGGAILEEIAPYWPNIMMMLMVAAGIGVLVWFSKLAEKSRIAAQEEEAKKKAASDAAVAKRKQKTADERKAIDDALGLIKHTSHHAKADMYDIPKCLEDAENSISRAAQNFSKRSFYPFWDSIADAVSNLQGYKNKVAHLKGLQTEYAERVSRYRALPNSKEADFIEPFPASTASLPALRGASQTAVRIAALYDRAHQDYEFSNIYANWKTNQTLLKGFTDLSRGLDAMQFELQSINFTMEYGFESVNSMVQETANASKHSINRQIGQLGSLRRSIDGVSGHLSTGRKTQSVSEQKMIDLLDNIQRGRESIPDVADYFKQFETRPVKR